jgi:starch synthase
VRVFTARHGDLPTYFLDCPEAFERDGMYGPRPSIDYQDNAWRFALLSRGALETCRRLRLHPDIIHCHDWHAGLLPLWCREELNGWVRTVQTIHNLGYQGSFPAHTVEELGIDDRFFQPDGIEFWGWMSFLKAGLVYADRITTVSPTYAQEIQTPRYGNGLDGVLRGRSTDIVGILNGIDTKRWDPNHSHSPSASSLLDKRAHANKYLRDQFHLEPGGHIVCVIGRLVAQKGVDLIPAAVRTLIEADELRLIVVGDGDGESAKSLLALADKFPGRVSFNRKYSYVLAQDVVSGSDALLMPSRYEPCGLTQLIAMRYGTLPIVRQTGGLADTVIDGENGYTFKEPTSDAVRQVLRRFLDSQQEWSKLRRRSMKADHSWTNSAKQYIELYEEVHSYE